MQRLAEAVERQRLDVELEIGGGEVGRALGEDADLRRRHGHRPTPPERIVERHAGAAQQRAVFDIERARAGDAEDRAQLQMVLQVLADAGRSADQVAAERSDDLRAADARQFEQLRRADRPGGEHDFAAGARLAADAVDGVAHADRAPAVENQPLDMRAGDDAQVRAVEDRFEEAARRAPPPSAPLVDVEIVGAFVVAAVEVVDLGDADLGRRVAHRVEDRPRHARPFDPPFAARAVQFVGAAVIVLVALEERQHVVPAPALEAELAPAVVVGGLAAHIDHAVDGGRSAEHAAARIGDRAAVEPLLRRGLEPPVGARTADGEEIADRNVQPDPVVAAARFEQQHAMARIGGEAVGEHSSRPSRRRRR